MIKLEIENYCHRCVGFEADVENCSVFYGLNGQIIDQTDTIIRCEHRYRCNSVYRQLKEELSKHEG